VPDYLEENHPMDAQNPAVNVPPHVQNYLSDHHILTLATASPGGLPHAATMIYANDGLAVYFCTRPDTRTARHIDQNPMVSFTIDEYHSEWKKSKGIQGSGEAHALLDADEIRGVVRLFQQKYPLLADGASKLSFFSNLSFFRITPSEVHYIDNEGGSQDVGQSLGMEWRRSLIFSVFRGLPQKEVETIAARLDTVQYAAGDVIVRQGAPADKFFIIVDGEVEVVREEGGGAQPVATLRRGQFFGEIAILRDTPRTATVRAVGPTTLLSMDRDTFRGLVSQALATTQDFDQVIQQRLAQLG
jgi:nitroimidazol reductase NimA-like FMN-containing flavoprotein (pyridoxamine 5'-phosphate oxidase superfamily)